MFVQEDKNNKVELGKKHQHLQLVKFTWIQHGIPINWSDILDILNHYRFTDKPVDKMTFDQGVIDLGFKNESHNIWSNETFPWKLFDRMLHAC